MDITQEDAQESLNQVQDVSVRMRRAIASNYANGFLILWGSIWSIAAIGSHLRHEWAVYIWSVLDAVGIVGTIIIARRRFSMTSTKTISRVKGISWRIIGLWGALYVYVVIWLTILRPESGIQMNAFIGTACMFVFIVMGLWFESYFMVWLGLAVTGAILAGLYLVPHGYYNLCTAVFGGGTLLGVGLYIRKYWK
jgi:hypothetical protein